MKPEEILQYTVGTAEKKAASPLLKLVILGMMAGAFISFAAHGSNMAAFNLLADPSTYGLGKVLAGAIFATGLMLVLLCGGELFTGNTLMIAALCEKKIRVQAMLRNWITVYAANLAGALLIVALMDASGLYSSGGGLLGAVVVKTAAYKVSLSFLQAFCLGIMCNWLVCLAVWMCYGAENMAGKILGIFFPIWLFVTSGFEHSIANMFYIPAGILLKDNTQFVQMSGAGSEALQDLTWGGFFADNLLPVTLGNIIGGGIFVALMYWIVFRKKENK